jgi:hypothetical protein
VGVGIGERSLRLLLRFEGHTGWSLPEMEAAIQKLTGYLDKNKIAYHSEIGEYGAFQTDVTAVDLPGFLTFLNSTLHAPAAAYTSPTEHSASTETENTRS